jgi:3-oxoacyl-[acyl-carrier protein] reductase
MDFNKRTVLVTGASGGIGRSIAREFAERGATVVVHYRFNEQGAEKTLEDLSGGPHYMLPGDLTDPTDCLRLIETTVQVTGSLGVLVNNAGVFEDHPIAEVDFATWQRAWQRTLAVNLTGPANLIHCALEPMKAAGGGRIVNISSRGAFRGEPTSPAYGASKGALNAMGQSLALALAPDGIFIYTIAPGFVATDRVAPKLSGPLGDDIRNQSPLGRVAKPEEIAATTVWLAGEAPEFMTGCIIDVNGASYLRS